LSNEKTPLTPVSNENPLKPPAHLSDVKQALPKLTNQKASNVPQANEKPAVPPLVATSPSDEKDCEDSNAPIVLSELEAFHLKQCHNKVRVRFERKFIYSHLFFKFMPSLFCFLQKWITKNIDNNESFCLNFYVKCCFRKKPLIFLKAV
jgi:hypothetical protein